MFIRIPFHQQRVLINTTLLMELYFLPPAFKTIIKIILITTVYSKSRKCFKYLSYNNFSYNIRLVYCILKIQNYIEMEKY